MHGFYYRFNILFRELLIDMEGSVDLVHEFLSFFEKDFNKKMHVACGKFSNITKGFCIDSGTRSQGSYENIKWLGCGFISSIFFGLVSVNVPFGEWEKIPRL